MGSSNAAAAGAEAAAHLLGGCGQQLRRQLFSGVAGFAGGWGSYLCAAFSVIQPLTRVPPLFPLVSTACVPVLLPRCCCASRVCRPLSKTVRFNVLRVIPAGSGGDKKGFSGF